MMYYGTKIENLQTDNPIAIICLTYYLSLSCAGCAYVHCSDSDCCCGKTSCDAVYILLGGEEKGVKI